MELGDVFNKEINLIKINEIFKSNIEEYQFNIYHYCTNKCDLNFSKIEISEKEKKCLLQCNNNYILNSYILYNKIINN